MNNTKRTCAIHAAEPAIPPKPSNAAIRAMIKKVSAQLSIEFLSVFLEIVRQARSGCMNLGIPVRKEPRTASQLFQGNRFRKDWHAKGSGEHTRPRVWCSASRRTRFSGGTPEIARGDACAPRTLRRCHRFGNSCSYCARPLPQVPRRLVPTGDRGRPGGKASSDGACIPPHGSFRGPRKLRNRSSRFRTASD
jgi:hypothetical protein